LLLTCIILLQITFFLLYSCTIPLEVNSNIQQGKIVSQKEEQDKPNIVLTISTNVQEILENDENNNEQRVHEKVTEAQLISKIANKISKYPQMMVKTPGNRFINKQQVKNTTQCLLGSRDINAWTFYDSVIKQSESLQYMAELMNSYMNSLQLMDQMGKLNEDSIVFAVTVHNRVDYLHEFVESLRKINPKNCILVIYHHSIDQAMMDYVRSIDFMAVKQVIFPHTRTIFPHSYPGESPNDCIKDCSEAGDISAHTNNISTQLSR